MPKAIELPVNVLVIVAIAVIVLLGLVVLYFIGFNPFSGSINLTSLKSQGCSNFTLNYDCGRRGATTSDIILPANSYGVTTLLDLCTQKFAAPSDSECRAICGCGGAIGGSGGPGPPSVCDNDGTCDAGENNANCPSDCPTACTSCDWVVQPGSNCGDCIIVGFGLGNWRGCVCIPNGCGGTCTDSIGNQLPEGTLNVCILC